MRHLKGSNMYKAVSKPAEIWLAKRLPAVSKQENEPCNSRYLDLRFTLQMSNLRQSLFSTPNHTISDHQKLVTANIKIKIYSAQ